VVEDGPLKLPRRADLPAPSRDLDEAIAAALGESLAAAKQRADRPPSARQLHVGDVTTLGVPAGYILSEDDQALARPGTEFAARIGLTPVMVPGGHDSMLSRPDEVAEALLKI
jgi:pimeloyl-ACP methyl ester carboxylesterase